MEKRLGMTCTLTPELEENLVARVLDMEARLYGLTKYYIRRVVYKFCEQNNVKHKFNTEKQLAGKKWMQGFMKRHKELANRIPEKTSLARAIGFNRSKVQLFFDTLTNQLFDENGNRKIPPEHIFNVDETGITVCQKAQKIIGKRGKKNVGIMTSAEKGKNITVVCCVSAAGFMYRPFFYLSESTCRPRILGSWTSWICGSWQ